MQPRKRMQYLKITHDLNGSFFFPSNVKSQSFALILGLCGHELKNNTSRPSCSYLSTRRHHLYPVWEGNAELCLA